MTEDLRTPLQDEFVRAMIDNKAIDFEALGSLFSKYGARAAIEGDSLVQIINKNVTWNCGWPGPLLREQIERRQY